jgi:hypothetical protein
MWEQRNGEVNNPESPASLREHARLDALITTNYEDVSTFARKDRRWFCRLKEVLFTESLEYKHQWLESVRLAHVICTSTPNLHPRPTYPHATDILSQIHTRASTNYPPMQSLVSTVTEQPDDTTLCTSPHVFHHTQFHLLHIHL